MTYKVIQADRDAADLAYLECYEQAPNPVWLAAMRAGAHDDDPLVQHLAKHREDTEARCSFPSHSPPEISARSGVAPYSGRFTRPSIDGKHLDQWYAKVNGQVVIPDADGGFAAQAGDVVEIIPGMPE